MCVYSECKRLTLHIIDGSIGSPRGLLDSDYGPVIEYVRFSRLGFNSQAILEINVRIAHFGLRYQWISIPICGSDPGSALFVR